MKKIQEKIKSAKNIIEKAVEKYENVGMACSFGKDSMVTVDIAREVDPEIQVFSVATIFMPDETFEYIKEMNREMNLNTKVYIATDEVPELLQAENLEVISLPFGEFEAKAEEMRKNKGEPIYRADPDECCRLLKVKPLEYALKDLDLDAWISGLRNTESSTREDKDPFERRDGHVKVNPILPFTERDVFGYLEEKGIKLHPWYKKDIDGKRYRSLGCAPCTEPVSDDGSEREGRWSWCEKTECGIHNRCPLYSE